MFDENITQIIESILGIIIAGPVIAILGKLVWFQPETFEKMMIEKNQHHPLSIYISKNYRKNMIWWCRIGTLLGVFALLKSVVDALLIVTSLIK